MYEIRKFTYYLHTKGASTVACIDGCEIHICNACYYQWFQNWQVVPYDGMAMTKHVGVEWLLNQILYVHFVST